MAWEPYTDNVKEISNCYNTGIITGNSESDSVGEIAGYWNVNNTNLYNCYYLNSANRGIGNSSNYEGTTSMTDEEMKSADFVTLLNDNQSSIETEYELLEWVISETYPIFETDLYFELDINVTITEETVIDTITELIIEDKLLTYNITTEIGENSSGSRTGGTITGSYNYNYSWASYINYVETVTHGENALTDIVITPSDGYEIISITLDGEEVEYEIAEDGTVTLPALENVTADHHYIVTFDIAEREVVINKVDKSTGEALEGVTFQIDQIEDRNELTDEEKSEIIGDMTDNSSYTQAVVNTDEEITDEVLGELTSAGTYYFEENEDGTLTSNNSGVSYVTANSYLTIDLTDYEGTYAVVVNGEVSGSGYGYATITSSNSSAPYYYSSSGRFMYIYGTTDSANYTSSILEGGNIYYLYLGFYTINTKDSQALINSINVYSAEEEDCVFVENEDGSYSSNNHSDYSYANSYMEIDLSNYSGMYTLTVNAEISTGSWSYGYATVTQTTDAPYYYSNNGRFIYITGEQEAADYTYELEGGTIYYLHFGYYNYLTSYNINTDEKFTINSIDLAISNSDFSSATYTTDENGQIIAYLHDGTYTVTEIEGLDGYDELSEPVTLTFRTSNKSVANDSNVAYYDEETGEYTIYNTKVGNILVHHILVDSSGNIVYDENGNPTYVAEDESSEGSDGESYTTSPQMDLTEYTLATNAEVSEDLREDNGTGEDDDYYIPSNSYGTYISGETIEITYYYVVKEIPLTVYHYIAGTTTPVPTSSDDVETVLTDSGSEGDEYLTSSLSEEELAEKYELVSTPANAEGIYEYDEIIVIYYYQIVERDLSLVKTNEDGETIEGVTFAITGVDEDTEGFEETYTTNSAGKISATLEYGTYEVHETATVEGYDLNETVYTIKVTKDGISLVTYEEEVDESTGEIETTEVLTLLETNDNEAYVLDVENAYTRGNVIVHHYIYDETQENPYTENQVPSKDGGTVADEEKEGIVGDIYATQASENIDSSYEFIESSDNTSGEYIAGTIEVYYYYKITDPTIENEITKTADIKIIETENQAITYTISYDVSISNYAGKATITITDYLPYEIDVDSSELDEGEYSAETQTITWEEEIEVTEQYENTFEKEITVVYVDPDVNKNIENTAVGTVTTYYPDSHPEYPGEPRITVNDEDTEIVEQEYLTTVEVRKVWDDNDNAKEHRPESVTISLLANGETAYNSDGEEITSVVLNEENEWKYTFTNLLKYDGEEEIEYTIKESETTGGDLEYYETAEITYGEEYVEVKNSYKTKETDLSAEITKTATEKITASTDEVTYTISYSATIKDYIGDATLTVVDTLPYGIVEESSDLSEGTYDSNSHTITWKVDLGHINTDENGDYEVSFEKTITVVYGENLEVTVQSFANSVNATVYLLETGETNEVTDEAETEIEIPTKVTVKYVDIDTGEELIDGYEIDGKPGDEYETIKETIDGYSYVKDTNNTEGEMTEETIEVIYYYQKNAAQVHVTYVDIDTGEEIADDEIIDGYENDEYTTNQKDIEYYKFVESTDNTTGKMTIDRIEVIYYYRKLAFNFSVDKTISSVTQNGSTTTYDKSSVKVEVGRNDVDSTSITVTYKIVVTNTEELAGTGTVIDYLPDYFTVSSSNPSYWTTDDDGNLRTTVSLGAGESTELTVILDWVQGEENFGTTTNIAQIVNLENEPNYSETTTADNESSAKLIVSVRTGWDTVNEVSPYVILALCGVALIIIGVKKNKNAKTEN